MAVAEWMVADRVEPADWLGERELAALRCLSHPVRRRQWLAARVALKRLLMESGQIDSPFRVEIKRGPSGRPELLMSGRQTIACSLSHSGDRVMTACRRFADGLPRGVGVDIERINRRLSLRLPLFASPGDGCFPAKDENQRATLLWCLKEAAAKALCLNPGSRFRDLVCRDLGRGRCSVSLAGSRRIAAGWYETAGGWVRVALCRRPSIIEPD